MKKIIFLFVLLFFCLHACEQDPYSTIPNWRVNITLDLDYQDSDLIPILATKSITQKRNEMDEIGFGGVLVINGISTDGSLINLFAYDLACPVEAERDKRVIPNDIGKAVCPYCGTVYVIDRGYGYSESGTKLRLRTYSVSPLREGNKRYLVFN
jgi:hypothetical protein